MSDESAHDGSTATPIEALNAATRDYDRAVRAFLSKRGHLEQLRRELRRFSTVPLALMASHPFDEAIEMFPELVLNLCQGNALGIHLARNIIRTFPKTMVDRYIVEDLESLVVGMDADELAQLADLVVELGLPASLERIRTVVEDQSDDEMQGLAKALRDVEHDEKRWRRSRAERAAVPPNASDDD